MSFLRIFPNVFRRVYRLFLLIFMLSVRFLIRRPCLKNFFLTFLLMRFTLFSIKTCLRPLLSLVKPSWLDYGNRFLILFIWLINFWLDFLLYFHFLNYLIVFFWHNRDRFCYKSIFIMYNYFASLKLSILLLLFRIFPRYFKGNRIFFNNLFFFIFRLFFLF